jgi:hypothetical protein
MKGHWNEKGEENHGNPEEVLKSEEDSFSGKSSGPRFALRERCF